MWWVSAFDLAVWEECCYWGPVWSEKVGGAGGSLISWDGYIRPTRPARPTRPTKPMGPTRHARPNRSAQPNNPTTLNFWYCFAVYHCSVNLGIFHSISIRKHWFDLSHFLSFQFGSISFESTSTRSPFCSIQVNNLISFHFHQWNLTFWVF